MMSRKLIAWALTMSCLTGAAEAVELEIGKTYTGGTLIEAKTFGLSFTVPEGWSGLLPPGGTFFAMTPDNRTFVFATAEPGSLQEAQGSLGQALPLGNGIQLQPIGAPRPEGDGFTINYNVLGAPEPLGSEGRAIVSDTGVIAGFIGVAPQDAFDAMRTTLDDITDGVGFNEIGSTETKP
ncbi:MAG: hypothetical protein ACR2RA_16180 [Geminicoccaceae bacterium]